jgi:hypothetical protein
MRPEDVESMVVGDGRLSALDRLDIYAHMYFFRILDVLRDAYPKVAAVLGEDAFHNLIVDYLVACPPAHPSLSRAGRGLPAFIVGHREHAQRPWLVELARIERAYVDLFDGPDTNPITVDDLRQLGPEPLVGLRITLVRCHALVENEFAVADLWRRLDRNEAAGEVARARESVVVWRAGINVLHRDVDHGEAAHLRAVVRGTTIGRLCEEMGEGRNIDDAAQEVFNLVYRWAAAGLITAT